MAEIEHLLPVKNQLQLPVVNAILTGRGCSIFAIRFTVYRGIRISDSKSRYVSVEGNPHRSGRAPSLLCLFEFLSPAWEGGRRRRGGGEERGQRAHGRTDADVRGC